MEHIGRYEIRGEVGRGGMGVVYRAFDPQLEREVAIKSMLVEGDEAATQQFFREAQAAARLNHPGIVAVHDVIRDGSSAYIVMELIRGVSLEQNVPSGKPAALRILREAAAALDFAHALGVVHRDIKPGNILIDETGHVKVADFGIAKVGNKQAANDPEQTSGTAGYMSPEQIRGELLDGRADQFSLAVLAYKLLCGKLPFDAPNWVAITFKILKEEPAQPVGLSKEEGAAILKGLSKQAADRFPSCIALVEAMTLREKPSESSRRYLGVGIVAALLLALGGFWAYQSASQAPAPVIVIQNQKVDPAPAVTAPAVLESKPVPKADPHHMEIGGVPFEFAPIPAGQFKMGSDDPQDTGDERPAHMVTLSKAFQLGKTEVTRKQWEAVMGGKAPDGTAADLPMTNVSFEQVQAFLNKLNSRGDGFRYRLPSEAEWEYAARAGTKGPLYGKMDEIGWHGDNSGKAPHPVGRKEPNAWGLNDMIGNAWEWVADWHGAEYYASSPAADPKGPPNGTIKMFRGGSYLAGGMILRVSYRQGAAPTERGEDIGFRLAR